MITSKELREKYIEFFKERGHSEIPSASLVPENDPTVLFATAGTFDERPAAVAVADQSFQARDPQLKGHRVGRRLAVQTYQRAFTQHLGDLPRSTP